MSGTGFEPVRLATIDLESIPLDLSGTLTQPRALSENIFRPTLVNDTVAQMSSGEMLKILKYTMLYWELILAIAYPSVRF